MYRVDITADLNAEDDTGWIWTFLDEAHDPAQIVPGALIVAGDDERRMDDELPEALKEKADHSGISRSEAIREAVRVWTHVA